MADSALRPGKVYRVSRIEMITPKTVLINTAQKAIESVSWKAKSTSGCWSASITGASPRENVALATSATGQMTRKNRYVITTSRGTQRKPERLRTVITLPVTAARAVTGGSVSTSAMPGHPPGDEVEQHDDPAGRPPARWTPPQRPR